MPEPFKEYYSVSFVEKLAEALSQAEPSFSSSSFLSRVLDENWKDRELKQRLRHITLCLGEELPGDYAHRIKVLEKVAPGFGGLPALVFPDFAEVYGLDEFDISIKAIELFTTFSTGEFAVRPFFIKHFDKMAAQHLAWAKHKNHHVRRLASEGIRPRLPWGLGVPVLKKDPSAIFPVLALLADDESEYVRKSVANNLNDISKDHPEQVLAFVKKLDVSKKETARLVKHALRGLLKNAHPGALALFGYGKGITISGVKLSGNKERLAIGDKLSWEAGLDIKGKGKLRLEYAMYFQLKSGKTGRKIFQVGEYEIDGQRDLTVVRNHSFKDLTIRKHVPGIHKLELIGNGNSLSVYEFDLTEK